MAVHARSRIVRWVDLFLWIVAVASLGIASYTWIDAWLYQSFADLSFVRSLNGETTAPTDFALYLLGAADPLPEPPILARGVVRDVAPKPWQGRLEIPRIGLSVMVLEGTSVQALARGVGHIEGTSLPGTIGNSGLAAHRDTFFRRLGELQVGDDVWVRTLDGPYRYIVDETMIVAPSAVEVLDDVGKPVLTLVTCYPFGYIGSAPKRYVVKAALSSTAD
jgi:sortase A